MNEDIIRKYFNLSLVDFEKDLRGQYSTSFFHIYTAGDYNKDLNVLSIKDRGTFIHEYIHYWQNIGTLWGLGDSILRYNEIRHIVNKLKTETEVKLPLQIEFPENLKKEREKYKIGNGTSDDKKFENKIVDTDKQINIQFDRINEITVVKLKVSFTDGTSEEIILGAHIIKESMATLYQELLDPDTKHNDVPYNVVKLLCDSLYPKLSGNIPLMICVCYASLFSMRPGETLIDLLANSTKENIFNGISLIDLYLNSAKVISSKHNSYISVNECFNEMVDCFLDNLRNNLVAPLDYIEEAMQRVKLSNDFLPLLTVLQESPEKLNENLNHIVGYMGIPYIQTATNGLYQPSTTKKPLEKLTENDVSMDVMELHIQEAIFLYLLGKTPIRCCPLYYMCQGSGIEKFECFDTPWEGTECSFTMVGNFLKNKNIHW